MPDASVIIGTPIPTSFIAIGSQQAPCLLVRVPVVVGDISAAISIETGICLNEHARRIDHVDAVVRDLEGDPIWGGPANDPYHCTKPWTHEHCEHGGPCEPQMLLGVAVHGTIHQQIYYVGREDIVRYTTENIFFNKTVNFTTPIVVRHPRMADICFKSVNLEIYCDLVRPTRAHQTATVSFLLKIMEDQQIYVQTCPNPSLIPTGELLQDPGFENWTGNTLTFWTIDNGTKNTTVVHGGSASAELGTGTAGATAAASLTQTVLKSYVMPSQQYRLTFWANVDAGTPSAFTLTAGMFYYDSLGNLINSSTTTLTQSQLTAGTWQQFSVTGTTPSNVSSVNVSFEFTPSPAGNASTVKIDDASLMAVT